MGIRLYSLEYLPAARQDMVEIVQYIGGELHNPQAAERLALKLIAAGDGLLDFPYANPVHMPVRPLKHEYRKLLVDSYLVFYWVDEREKLITVARVIYAGRSFDRWLE